MPARVCVYIIFLKCFIAYVVAVIFISVTLPLFFCYHGLEYSKEMCENNHYHHRHECGTDGWGGGPDFVMLTQQTHSDLI